jgi:decaprenylphospho-beta-D-erythro-pentofuranosid-2-ulose 2-reductase
MAGWVILGASSPIARAFAAAVAAEGARVILAGRETEMLERDARDLRIRFGAGVDVMSLDARDMGAHPAFARACRAEIADELNLFLAIGAMPPQEESEKDFAIAQAAIESSFVGAASLLSAFAPLLEAQERGAVVALGSVAGDRGRLKNYVYGSAKAGLHAFLQGLRARLARKGVHVVTVKPGFVDTAMTFGMPGIFLVASPEDCANACLAAARRGRDVLYFPIFWWPIMAIIRSIPERWFKKLSI